VLAAIVEIINAGGGEEVVLVGASMGGTASLIAATELSAKALPVTKVRVAGVATLSAPVEFKGLSAEEAVPKLQAPLLFVAAKDDVGAAGATELQGLSGNTGDLQIVPGKDHGTDLLKGSEADMVWDLLMGFLKKQLPVADQ
jgi:pimeloyl-ACP methyl ester carboxylesterase